MTAVGARPPQLLCDDEVTIPVDDIELAGHVQVPYQPISIVIVAHGSGTDRRAPSNRYVAQALAGHRSGPRLALAQR